MRVFRFWVVFLVSFGCSIDDADRCEKGFTWDPDVQSCRKDAEDTDTATSTDADADADADADTDTDTDTEVDAGDDSGDADTVSGLGEECWDQDECAEYEADFCVLSILKPDDPGFCSIKDCNPGGCPDGYQCCDCSGLGSDIMCLTDEGAATAGGYGCSCA